MSLTLANNSWRRFMLTKDGVSIPEATIGASHFDQGGARRGLGGQMFYGLRQDVRHWYALYQRNDATKILVWTMCLELTLMVVLLILLPFDTVQVEGRPRLIKPLNFSLSMVMYLATVVILLDYLR